MVEAVRSVALGNTRRVIGSRESGSEMAVPSKLGMQCGIRRVDIHG